MISNNNNYRLIFCNFLFYGISQPSCNGRSIGLLTIGQPVKNVKMSQNFIIEDRYILHSLIYNKLCLL